MAYRWGFRQAGVVVAAVATTHALTACGGGTSTSNPPQPAFQQPAPLAATDVFEVLAVTPGITPFISLVEIAGSPVQDLAGIEFTIAPKPGSVSSPVHVRYSLAALSREQLAAEQASSVPRVLESAVRLPVFGLYAGYQNQVLVQLDFLDGSTKSLPVVITTAPYTDPNGIYDRPTVLVPRAPGSTLSFNFFLMKSALGSPVIVDTDAQLRWVGAPVSLASAGSFSSIMLDDGFLVGSGNSTLLTRLGFDGSLSNYFAPNAFFYEFHHNIDYGKTALFAEVNDYFSNGAENIESTLIEMEPEGTVDHTWDLAQIISNYMSSQGDDPTAFVRPGVDWFHMNASTYDPRDDSVIVSSREDFLIKLDYSTGNIKWILGDPTKYWYTFASLRAKALTLQPGGLYPIGQHAVSITSDGLIMVMNDGLNSANQPAGAPSGVRRTFSAVSAYSIDPVNYSAQEVWRFDYGQSIFAPICGSSYEAPGGTYLVDFATADNETHARLIGLDSDHNVVFDFQYATTFCNTSWNATPIALDNFAIM